MSLKYKLNHIVVKAIMSKQAVIIVEGKDDRKIYQRMIDELKIEAVVWQVNEFKDYHAGCKSVIEAIHILQPKFEERTENIHYVLGIIDRDSRPYRPIQEDEIDYKSLKGLLVLKHYSIETYFATKTNLKRMIAKMTHLLERDISEEAIRFVEQNIEDSLEGLYYISLEALRNACDIGYEAVIGYKGDEKGHKVSEKKSRTYLLSQILPKQTDLDAFAKLPRIAVSIKDIKQICKGKWFLYNYIYRANYHIQQLSEKCRKGEIPRCRSCSVGNFKDCLYTLKANYKGQALYDDILEFVDWEECSDIVEKFKQLVK